MPDVPGSDTSTDEGLSPKRLEFLRILGASSPLTKLNRETVSFVAVNLIVTQPFSQGLRDDIQSPCLGDEGSNSPVKKQVERLVKRVLSYLIIPNYISLCISKNVIKIYSFHLRPQKTLRSVAKVDQRKQTSFVALRHESRHSILMTYWKATRPLNKVYHPLNNWFHELNTEFFFRILVCFLRLQQAWRST